MRLNRLLLFTIVCLAAAPALRADEAAIALPLRVYTFPELARTLSTGTRTVVCPAAFSQRAVLVHLEKRTWDQARTILQTGLQLRFRRSPDKPETWLMETDPVVEARHDLWLTRLAE